MSAGKSTAAINLANLRASVNYRKPAKPLPQPACKNCGYYLCDHEDREGAKGVYFETSNSRCRRHTMPVGRTSVCDTHEFKHADRRGV